MGQTIEITLDEQVELCRSGNRRAYFDIYQRYAKPMLNSSMRIVNNFADAEDMVQEAFVEAFKNIESFTYKSSFEAWLRRIVINRSISFLRKRKINWVDADITKLEDEDNVSINEDDFLLDIERIKEAIKQLPDTHRVIFNLFTIDEMPQEEIGKLLGLSHNNVRTIYHRARKKIIGHLQIKNHAG